MKINICASFPGTALVLSLSLGLTPQPASAEALIADKIFTSNYVLTMASNGPGKARPMAIAVNGERISWVGDISQAAARTGPQTELIEFGDNAILPGFIDAHGHVSFSSLASNLANVASPPVGPVNNIADLQNTLRAYLAEREIPKGEWIVGMGYDDSLIAEKRHPDRDDLDAVSTDHPILLIHVSGHLIATNSAGLARGGYSAESINPPGGIIRRRKNSAEPNGVLEETATGRLRQYMSAPDTDPLGSIERTLQDYASYGITTAQDGAASAEVIRLLQAAAAAGKLPLDVVAYPLGQSDPEVVATTYTWGEYDKRLKIAGIKLILDGSPQGKTAYLSKPYHVHPPGQDADYAGYPTITPLETNRLVGAYLSKQIPIIAHANGDAAADMLIDAVARARPQHDHRTVMIHAQTVREDQLTRMKTLAMIPSFFSAHTFYWGDWHRDSVLGEERASRISPTASTQQRGMVFTVHNDAPIVPPDMLRLLWATTNRQTRSGQILGPEQRISTYEALRAMTIYAAYQQFDENDKGSIEVGKLADLVVLSADPLSVDATELLDLSVKATFARGAEVYRR